MVGSSNYTLTELCWLLYDALRSSAIALRHSYKTLNGFLQYGCPAGKLFVMAIAKVVFTVISVIAMTVISIVLAAVKYVHAHSRTHTHTHIYIYRSASVATYTFRRCAMAS